LLPRSLRFAGEDPPAELREHPGRACSAHLPLDLPASGTSLGGLSAPPLLREVALGECRLQVRLNGTILSFSFIMRQSVAVRPALGAIRREQVVRHGQNAA